MKRRRRGGGWEEEGKGQGRGTKKEESRDGKKGRQTGGESVREIIGRPLSKLKRF